jgi:uncharacterized paraquat-inducible protein A
MDMREDTTGLPPRDPRGANQELLATFLSQQDAHCPKCRFNLRGLQASVCPECGARLFLYVGSPSPRHLAYQTGLALLAGGTGFCAVVVMVMILQSGLSMLSGWHRITLDFDSDHGFVAVVLFPLWLVLLLLWIRNSGRICGWRPGFRAVLCGAALLLLVGMAFLMSAMG